MIFFLFFFRLTNSIFSNNIGQSLAWDLAIKIRRQFLKNNTLQTTECKSGFLENEDFVFLFLKQVFDENVTDSHLDIDHQTLELSGEVFIFLYSCPTHFEDAFTQSIQPSASETIISLNQLRKNSKTGKEFIKRVLANILPNLRHPFNETLSGMDEKIQFRNMKKIERKLRFKKKLDLAFNNVKPKD